jgi:hypothetical protein
VNTEVQSFQPNEHLINLGNANTPRWYLPVQWRLVWLREQCPEAKISTEVIHLDFEKGIAVFRATIKHGEAEAVGTGSETIRDFRDYIEKAETKAIGRALAGLGFGTQFAPELDEGDQRIADAPVQRSARPQTVQQAQDDPTIKAVNQGLYEAALKAKQRGQKMGFITDDTKWEALLQHLSIEQFTSGADIAKVNGKLTEMEKKPKAS